VTVTERLPADASRPRAALSFLAKRKTKESGGKVLHFIGKVA
jgi:hypothetical protein